MSATVDLIDVIDEAVAEMVVALDEVFEEVVKPLLHFGQPEDIIGKKFEFWTAEDLEKAKAIFQEKILEDFIFRREFAKMVEAEKEEVK